MTSTYADKTTLEPHNKETVQKEPALQSPQSASPVVQRKNTGTPTPRVTTVFQPNANPTGLPDGLKAGVERLSGLSMDAVRVHYRSPKPDGVNALAYTKGNDIHLGPGQEKHLPHEAWHAVQQRQGRVKPTMQLKSDSLNDDSGLEREANVMGVKAAQMGPSAEVHPHSPTRAPRASVRHDHYRDLASSNGRSTKIKNTPIKM